MSEAGRGGNEAAAAPTMLSQAAEDTSGFGLAELRLTRDLLIRPKAVMEAFRLGPSGGGRYARPLRYLLGLNGAMLFIMAFMGGFQRTMPADMRQMFADLASQAGKSLDQYMADFEHLLALFLVPVWLLFTLFPLAFLFRSWTRSSFRQALRDSLVYLSLWTLLFFVPGMLAYVLAPDRPEYSLASFLLAPVAFWWLGRGLWFRTVAGGLVKGVAVTALILAVYVPSSVAAFFPAMLGAALLP